MSLFDFKKDVLNKIGFPSDAVTYIEKISIAADGREDFKALVRGFTPEFERTEQYIKTLDAIAEDMGKNKHSLYLVFLLNFLEPMRDAYIKKGIPDEIFYDTVSDFKYKLDECMETKGVWGIMPFNWYFRFFRLDRFKLGRFQYELLPYQRETYEKNGKILKNSDPVLNIHIPSCGPMKKADREESYKKAIEFFKLYFNKEPVAFTLSSWLLYPAHYEYLDPDSNIVGLMNDFDIISKTTNETCLHTWRIYGKYADLPLEELPEDTGLRRAYKKWLLNGGDTGAGFGVRFI